MNVMIDLCIVPLGVGVSVSQYIAACQKVFEDAGLTPRMHAYGTGVEGDWDIVMSAVQQCFTTIHAMGAPRIHATMRMGTRNDRQQQMSDKVDSVTAILEQTGDPQEDT